MVYWNDTDVNKNPMVYESIYTLKYDIDIYFSYMAYPHKDATIMSVHNNDVI